MKSTSRQLASALALGLAASGPGLAQGEPPDLSWSLALTSDYVFRGISQSRGKPALQAGVTRSWSGGAYAGTWTSGVDQGPGEPNREIDVVAGYRVPIGDAIELDVSLNRYVFPGAGTGNYNELVAVAGFADAYRLSLAYTDDLWHTGSNSLYLGLGASWPMAADVTLDIEIGHAAFRRSARMDVRDYMHWGVALVHRRGLFSASLGLHGTSAAARRDFGAAAGNRAVLTLGLGR